MENYEQTCFVIMPFGKRPVNGSDVDFNAIYEEIFAPAISDVPLPEGGNLKPYRTDKTFFAADINNEMYSYLEYSRFALTDISAENANVYYELGMRHHTRASGTAIFRQTGTAIPFDIKTVKVFTYEFGAPEKKQEARALVTKVLTDSLTHNRLDSPIRLVLDRQLQQSDAVKDLLLEAANAIHDMDANRAIQVYQKVISIDRSNPLHRMKLGLLRKEQGQWVDAISQFNTAVSLSGRYAEAWREKGIAENKLAFGLSGKTGTLPQSKPAPGEADLRQAISLNDDDFDAHASLGGILKRAGRNEEALQCYRRARELSNHHPYPLLNEIKLRAFINKRLDLTGEDSRALTRAERMRQLQVNKDPPYDSPWCFFDLAEIKLYNRKIDEYSKLIEQGINQSSEPWQPRTVRASLALLEPAAASLPGLERGLATLDAYLRP